MIKPKITKGEWSVVKYEGHHSEKGEFIGAITSSTGESIYNGPFAFKAIKNPADAQAISAVPEMLDALICIVEEADEMYEYSDATEKAKEALTKAGVVFKEPDWETHAKELNKEVEAYIKKVEMLLTALDNIDEASLKKHTGEYNPWEVIMKEIDYAKKQMIYLTPD